MNDIKINSTLLKAKIDSLKKINREMLDLFESTNKKVSLLKNDWISDTADNTYLEFNNMYKRFSEIWTGNNKYIEFLTNVVNNNYTNIEDNLNKLVTTNLTTKDS